MFIQNEMVDEDTTSGNVLETISRLESSWQKTAIILDRPDSETATLIYTNYCKGAIEGLTALKVCKMKNFNYGFGRAVAIVRPVLIDSDALLGNEIHKNKLKVGDIEQHVFLPLFCFQHPFHNFLHCSTPFPFWSTFFDSFPHCSSLIA